MNANDLFDLIGNADDRIIVEAKKRNRPATPRWFKWAAVAACLCLAVGGLFAVRRSNETPPNESGDAPQIAISRPDETLPNESGELPQIAISRPRETPSGASGELPQIAIPQYGSDGMGFEALMSYSAEELENGNPWREDMALDTLPVFRNGSYDPRGAAPTGLNEAEMIAELESAAKVLGLEILDTKPETYNMMSEDGTIIPSEVYMISAITNSGSLVVRADGSLDYYLPSGYELPEGYHFTYYDTSDREAKEVMNYLTEKYAYFIKAYYLNFDHPEIVLEGDYTYDGDYGRSYFVYDAGTDITERILNYAFRVAEFVPDDDSGNLMLIRLRDGLSKAEKLGDYPLISVAEAKEKLLDGQYQTSVPVAMPGEAYISKVELVYRSGLREETFLPYYRFYVELQDADGWKMTQSNGLKTYGAFYVPAIQDDYISNLSTYNGSFN